MLGGTKDAKARKDCQKAMMAFRRVVFTLTSKIKSAVKDYHQNKSKGKEKARKKLTLNPDFQPLKHLKKTDIAMPGNLMIGLPVSGLIILGMKLQDGTSHTAWMAVPSLNLAYHPTQIVLDLGCTRSIGSRSAIKTFQKHSWYYGIATEICRCNRSFVFANSETETCSESCIIHFPTTPPCSTMVAVLETSNVPILFSLPQVRNSGMTLELDPQRGKITCPALELFSSPAENSTMGNTVLDLPSLTYQPTTNSRNRSGDPKKHVIFAMSERKTACPAQAPDMHEDEDEDDKPLVRPTRRKEPLEEGRDQAIDDEDLAPLIPPRPSRPPETAQRQKRGPPTWQDPTAILEQQVSRDSREREEKTSILVKKSEGEALRNIINKLSDKRNVKDLYLKRYHVSTSAVSRRRPLIWDIPGRIYDLYINTW